MYAERLFVYFLAKQFALHFSASFTKAIIIMKRERPTDSNKNTELWRWYYVNTLKAIAFFFIIV